MRKKTELTPAEQRRRFKETAREIEVDETEAGQRRALGKVGLAAKSTKKNGPKSKT